MFGISAGNNIAPSHDAGKPIVFADPDSEYAKAYKKLHKNWYNANLLKH